MSVRRLDEVQPKSFSFTPANLSRAKGAMAKFPQGKQASAVIQLLWFAQEQDGWVSRPAIETVAQMLDMSNIRVLEVATFYTMFQLSPVGRKAHIQVCGTTPCMLRGAEDLIAVCKRKIHEEAHHLNSDGTLSWEEVECMGACVNAPMVQKGNDNYEDLTPEVLSKLIDDWSAGRKTLPGPQNGRTNSMAEGGATTLLDKSLYGKQRSFTRIEAPPPPPAAPAAAAPASATPPAATKPTTPPAAPTPAANAPVVARVAKVDGAPELLKKPRNGKGDDLKLIWGVGPKFEKLLNKTGVWHFDQIASWSSQDIDAVDKKLKGFHGRIRRDDWVAQAKKLATGWRPESKIGERPASAKKGKK